MRGALRTLVFVLASMRAAAQPASQADSPEIEALYQKALDDFASGHFENAAAEFDEVGIRSFDSARQTVAREMAKQARKRSSTVATQAPAATTAAETPPTTSGTAAAAASSPAVDNPEAVRSRPRSRDSRYVLLVGTTLAGLGIYGPTMAVVSESSTSNNNKTQVGLYMLAAGTSFFVPYMLTRDEEVSWGMTDAWWHGASRGALHGAFVLGLMNDGTRDPTGKEIMTSLSLGSLLEGVGFTTFAWRAHLSAGTTNSLAKGSDFGTGFAIAATALVDPDAMTWRRASAAGLVGAAVGYVGGWYYGKLRAPTWGDGEVLRTTGIVGAYTAILPLILAENDSARTYLAFGMAGGAAGLALGDYLLTGRDFSAGQGIVTELSTLAGAAAGAGIGYLAAPQDSASNTDEKIIAVGAILGAAGGFALTYFGLDTKVSAPSSSAVTLQVVPDLVPDRRGLVMVGNF